MLFARNAMRDMRSGRTRWDVPHIPDTLDDGIDYSPRHRTQEYEDDILRRPEELPNLDDAQGDRGIDDMMWLDETMIPQMNRNFEPNEQRVRYRRGDNAMRAYGGR